MSQIRASWFVPPKRSMIWFVSMRNSIEHLTTKRQALLTDVGLASLTMELPERIAYLLETLDLDQPGLAAKMGTSKSVVNQWLSGKIKSMAPEYAFKFQRSTGYLPEWLMLGTGPEKALPEEAELIETYRSMKPHERAKWRLLSMVALDNATDERVGQTFGPTSTATITTKKRP